jgi:hypothetical protein
MLTSPPCFADFPQSERIDPLYFTINTDASSKGYAKFYTNSSRNMTSMYGWCDVEGCCYSILTCMELWNGIQRW